MEARKLTGDEIEDILSAIPTFPAPLKEIADFYRNQIVEVYRKKLRTVTVKPVIDVFKKLLSDGFQDAFVQPKCPVGLAAAASVGSNITQMTLNTFHVAGSNQQLASGVELIRQIANNTKKRKSERTTIHFENYNLVNHEAFEIINKMIGIKISSLLDSRKYSIIKKPNDWWYSHFESKVRRSEIVINSKDCLRLHFDKYLLYKYKITFEGIEEILLEEMPQIVCVWSPFSEGIFDIYTNQNLLRTLVERNLKKGGIGNMSDEELLLQFRHHEIIPALSRKMANVTGIEGLEVVDIVTKSVVSFMINHSRLSTNEDSVTWRVWIDPVESLVEGIPVEKYDVFFETLKDYGIKTIDKVHSDSDFHYDIEIPSTFDGMQPLKLFGKLAEEADKNLDESRKEQKRNNDYNLSKVDKLYRASNYIYANANTRDFVKILGYPEVNPERSICWNANVVHATLGIEAACNVIARDLHNVIVANGASIAPQHLYLIARSMCFTGNIVSITSRGATKQNRGALADASFELPIDAFVNSATFGRKEKLDAVSARIFVGNRCKLGTGGVEIEIDEEKLQKIIDKTQEREKGEVDLSFFERDDVQFIDRNSLAVDEVGDSIQRNNEENDNLFDNLFNELPEFEQGESRLKSKELNWLTEEFLPKSKSKTQRGEEDIGALIEGLLG